MPQLYKRNASMKPKWKRLRETLLQRPLLLLLPGCPQLSLDALQQPDTLPDSETLHTLELFLICDRTTKTTAISNSPCFRQLDLPDTQLSSATGIAIPKLRQLRTNNPPVLSYEEIAAIEILLNYLHRTPVSPENLPFLHTRHTTLITEFDHALATLINDLNTLQAHSFLLRMQDRKNYGTTKNENWYSIRLGTFTERIHQLQKASTQLFDLGHLLLRLNDQA